MRPPALEKNLAELPSRPGVYFFKDAEGKALYIGKAVSIRKRVLSHFRFYGRSDSKEGLMLGRTRRVDFVVTPNEAEALLLEASLVKSAQPPFNKELRDDKSYPFLKITGEEFPRLLVVRGRKADGGRYFGPYTSAHLLRQAVRMLRRAFPMRTCRRMPPKVCLQYHLGQCKGPCEGFQERASYLETVRELESFLEGRRHAMVRLLSRRMREHAGRQEYEKAKSLYEEIRAFSSLPDAVRKIEASGVLAELQKAVGLRVFPSRIEGFDVSNISGSQAVASLVVFEDGRPCRREYRRFRIRDARGVDDYRMMREAVRRHFRRRLDEKRALPDLVVIDGGKGHLSSAKGVLDELGLSGLEVMAIAKEHEHLFRPGREAPVILPLSSPCLELIRHLRDEAHRTAIHYHRRLHRREGLQSRLDEIPGVGEKTRRRLLTHLGSMERIRGASEEELRRRAGVNAAVARAVRHFFDQKKGGGVR